MILVESSEDEIKKFENDVYDCAFDLELKYGIMERMSAAEKSVQEQGVFTEEEVEEELEKI